MKTDDIKLLYEYNYWADGRILAASAKVNLEHYGAPTGFGTGYGSLRSTLVHILDGEWQWRLTCTGFYNLLLTDEDYKATELTEAQFPALDALQERWQVEQQAMRDYLGTLTDEQLNGTFRYIILGGIVRERVLWHCLLHAVNHGTQHRSEAAALLTNYGQSPGDLDFTLFLNEHFTLQT
jgi:uncharacterized damage-inducible protein DinB